MDAVEGGVQEGVVEERQRGGDLPEENGCDPWTAGESDPTGNPRDFYRAKLAALTPTMCNTKTLNYGCPVHSHGWCVRPYKQFCPALRF